jgi:hypothetical protein
MITSRGFSIGCPCSLTYSWLRVATAESAQFTGEFQISPRMLTEKRPSKASRPVHLWAFEPRINSVNVIAASTMRTICRPPRAVMVSVGFCCAPDVTCRPGRSPCQGFYGLSCLGGWCPGRASALSESCCDSPHLTIHQPGTRRLGLYQRRVELRCAGRYLTLTPMPRRACAGWGRG